ncbi:MAG: hypothetical protein R6V44_01595, partial [Paracoccaceae bacterium]
MAEKRVSVRLAATGGRQVRGEFDEAAGKGGRAVRRLSDEVERASRRLAGFARAARVAAGAAAVAAKAGAAILLRSSLQ